MSNTNLTQEEKKDLNRVFWRWNLMAQTAWNYEKMQAMGYVYALLPFIKKNYPKKEDQIEVAKTQNQFFNTHVTMANLIIGADVAIEREKGMDSLDLIPAVKTGLMGPFAGVGDTLFSVTLNTILGSIAAYMALQGSPIGCVLWILSGVIILAIAHRFMFLGYEFGQQIVGKLGNKLKLITDATVMMGMTVIGALIPSTITATVPLTWTTGDVDIVVQDFLNQIMPGLIPVLLVVFSYWMLGRKNMNSTRLIILVVVLAIVLYNLHLLG